MSQSEMSPDDPITVTMSRAEWEALLSVEPFAKETYTAPGIAIFNAFQAIHWAVSPGPTAEATAAVPLTKEEREAVLALIGNTESTVENPLDPPLVTAREKLR